MRSISVSFVLYSKMIDIKEIDRMIDLPNTELWYPPLPEYADPAWSVEVHSTACTIAQPIFELKSILEPRMDRIIGFVHEKGISPQVTITVKADCYADRPVISLPSSVFPFFEKLNAEINLDVLYGE